MIRTSLLIAVFASSLGLAQDLTTYNKALAEYNLGHFDLSAKHFFEVTSDGTDAELRRKAEYYLASSFQRLKLPVAALNSYLPIVAAGPTHPFHLKAIEALVTLQEELKDDILIPQILNKMYDKFADSWATLPLEVLSRINYLIGRISHEKEKLDEAKQFLEAVPQTSQIYAKAQYVLGITLVNKKYPAADEKERRRNIDHAQEIFKAILDLKTRQKDLPEVQQLATLALARTNYNIGEYAQSTEWYDKIPRFSKFWDIALFENGFARFENDDLGGGLGSLQGLYAPQFAGAFEPESWILTSTIYYFACLYGESKAALVEFEKMYLPMAETIKPLVDPQRASDASSFYKLVSASDTDAIPKPVLNWVRSNERIVGLLLVLKEIELEKEKIAQVQGWKAVKLSDELVTDLDRNRGQLEEQAGRLIRSRLNNALGLIKFYGDQAEIIRFEVAKAEKELAETGVNQRAMLAKQTLYRPKMPAENWNYWKFQGEFWRDEIGYYQYTLKQGCPKR